MSNTTNIHCVIWAAGLIAALCGCEHRDPNYCPGANPNNNCLDIDAGPDGPKACASSAECTPLVCDVTGSMTCVQCTLTEHDACSGGTPACVENVCKPCTQHAQCASSSNVCLPDGSCAVEGQVAYVQQGGTGTSCTKAAPCGTLQKAIDATKPYVKVSGAVEDGTTTTIDGRQVAIFADPGTKLDRTGDGRILLVRSNGANVSIYDLEISGATGIADEAIQLEPNGGVPALSLVRVKVTANQGRGISSSGGSLTVSQSTISSNTGGGISVTGGTFVVVGNVFFSNGALATTVGGVSIATTQSSSNRLEFNSFNKNQAQDGLGTAIQCIAGAFTARNNIMSDNGTLTNMAQTGGTCGHAYSIARPGPLPPGTANSAGDPRFADTTTGNLHLMAGSPALGAADPASILTGPAELDIDGQKRTAPADIGADEVP